jgi:hypothetical protein
MVNDFGNKCQTLHSRWLARCHVVLLYILNVHGKSLGFFFGYWLSKVWRFGKVVFGIKQAEKKITEMTVFWIKVAIRDIGLGVVSDAWLYCYIIMWAMFEKSLAYLAIWHINIMHIEFINNWVWYLHHLFTKNKSCYCC